MSYPANFASYYNGQPNYNNQLYNHNLSFSYGSQSEELPTPNDLNAEQKNELGQENPEQIHDLSQQNESWVNGQYLVPGVTVPLAYLNHLQRLASENNLLRAANQQFALCYQKKHEKMIEDQQRLNEQDKIISQLSQHNLSLEKDMEEICSRLEVPLVELKKIPKDRQIYDHPMNELSKEELIKDFEQLWMQLRQNLKDNENAQYLNVHKKIYKLQETKIQRLEREIVFLKNEIVKSKT